MISIPTVEKCRAENAWNANRISVLRPTLLKLKKFSLVLIILVSF